MKKRLSILCNQSGFYLPYVLFLTVVVLFTLVTHISVYQRDIQVTHQHLEQLRIETLNQMALKKMQAELLPEEPNGWRMNYSFPSGTVELKLHALSDDLYNLHVDILTSGYSERALYRPIRPEKLD